MLYVPQCKVEFWIGLIICLDNSHQIVNDGGIANFLDIDSPQKIAEKLPFEPQISNLVAETK
jgi:hypothetical protein